MRSSAQRPSLDVFNERESSLQPDCGSRYGQNCQVYCEYEIVSNIADSQKGKYLIFVHKGVTAQHYAVLSSLR